MDPTRGEDAPGVPRRVSMIDWYAHCTRVLDSANADLGFAEGHGMLCGRICSGEDVDVTGWIREVVGGEATGDLCRCEQVLQAVSEETHAQLSSPEFGFQPFLPDDDSPIELRCREFARWCQGFLYGLGASGRLDLPGLGVDAREVISDLSAFTRLASGGESEDFERDYCELVEYLRVGVMLVNEETSGRRRAAGEAGKTPGTPVRRGLRWSGRGPPAPEEA